MTPPATFALLRRIVDGEQTTVTADEAKAIHALVWDARQVADRARRARDVAVERAAELDQENVSLVAQVLAFERRMAVQALALASAVELLRAHDGDQRRYNPRGYRNAVRDFLSTLDASTG